MEQKLKKDFYNRNVLVVAQELLGKIFVVNDKNSGKKLTGMITEVEAYDGRIDEAAHTFNGKTKRNEIMFEEGGYLYVYFTYGVHFCANIVTGEMDIGTAILLRSMEPKKGIETFAERRFGKKIVSEKEKINLLNGPGKICQAFGLNKNHNGKHLTGNEIYLLDRDLVDKDEIVRCRRIGIKKSVDLPWRFYINENIFVSKYEKK